MFERIAIMGAGSLGTILGAYLSRAGRDVTFVDTYEEHVRALNEHGAHVVGKADFTVPARAVTPEQMAGTYDLFIYMAKQTSNDTAIPQMIRHCSPDSVICCCQNGVPEIAASRYWPAERICGAPVGWGATFRGPGVSELTSSENACTFHLGTYDGKNHPWLKEVRDILADMCETEVTACLMTDRWTKITINASFSGMSTVIGGTFGNVMDDDIGIQCLAMIINETHRVTKAEGIALGTFSGIDFGAAGAFRDKAGRKALQDTIRTAFVPHRALLASMLQDLRRGLRCEIAQIGGIVAEMGDKHDIDTPFTDMVIRLVNEMEAGRRVPCRDNLMEFVRAGLLEQL